jgi:hypothetical protein
MLALAGNNRDSASAAAAAAERGQGRLSPRHAMNNNYYEQMFSSFTQHEVGKNR